MKPILRILLMTAFLARVLLPPTLAATIQEIEKLPFDEAYRLWLKEKEALLQKQKSDVFVVPWGSTDQTGKFIPTRFFALTCRLGRDAHVQEAFLVKELSTNEYVSMILDSSALLCSRYGVESEAPVVVDPERGYRTRPRGGLFVGPDGRRRVWLAARAKANSQDGAANGSNPTRSQTNQSTSWAGSRR